MVSGERESWNGHSHAIEKARLYGGPCDNAYLITQSESIDSELVYQRHQVLGLVREIRGGL